MRHPFLHVSWNGSSATDVKKLYHRFVRSLLYHHHHHYYYFVFLYRFFLLSHRFRNQPTVPSTKLRTSRLASIARKIAWPYYYCNFTKFTIPTLFYTLFYFLTWCLIHLRIWNNFFFTYPRKFAIKIILVVNLTKLITVGITFFCNIPIIRLLKILLK